jgi:hypothetical protein
VSAAESEKKGAWHKRPYNQYGIANMSKQSNKSHGTSALIAGIAAFTTWGLVPIYWKLLKAVPATEILAHRFVWTSLFLIALLTWQHRWTEVETNVRSLRALAIFTGEAVMRWRRRSTPRLAMPVTQ